MQEDICDHLAAQILKLGKTIQELISVLTPANIELIKNRSNLSQEELKNILAISQGPAFGFRFFGGDYETH